MSDLFPLNYTWSRPIKTLCVCVHVYYCSVLLSQGRSLWGRRLRPLRLYTPPPGIINRGPEPSPYISLSRLCPNRPTASPDPFAAQAQPSTSQCSLAHLSFPGSYRSKPGTSSRPGEAPIQWQ